MTALYSNCGFGLDYWHIYASFFSGPVTCRNALMHCCTIAIDSKHITMMYIVHAIVPPLLVTHVHCRTWGGRSPPQNFYLLGGVHRASHLLSSYLPSACHVQQAYGSGDIQCNDRALHALHGWAQPTPICWMLSFGWVPESFWVECPTNCCLCNDLSAQCIHKSLLFGSQTQQSCDDFKAVMICSYERAY